MIFNKFYKNKSNSVILLKKYPLLGVRFDVNKFNKGYLRNYLCSNKICSFRKVKTNFLNYRLNINNIFFKKKYYYLSKYKKILFTGGNVMTSLVYLKKYNLLSLFLKINTNLSNLVFNKYPELNNKINNFLIKVKSNYKSSCLNILIKYINI